MQTLSEYKVIDNSKLLHTVQNLFINKSLYTTLLCLFFYSLLMAQGRSISGVVSDVKGNKLIGVTVSLKSLNRGTITSADGSFTISDIQHEDILIFSYTGMTTQEITIGNFTNLDVILEEDAQLLEEVVVVGYGTQKMGDITGAVSVISNEDIELRPNTQFAPLLYGKTAGVVVNPSSGKPGQGISLNIRGTSSLGGSDPLYVIDGVPTRDTRAINPNDIESISILKDASSAAIYGAQGANGVVLITTKSGQQGTPTINFSAYGGYSEVWKEIDVLDGDQYRELMTELGYNTNWALYFHNTDWQDQIFQRGETQNYQLSISGKSNQTSYYISGGTLKEIGAIRSAEACRQNFKLNLDQQLYNWIKAGARLSYNNYSDVDINDNSPANRSGVLLGALTTPSIIDIYNDDGSFTANPFQDWENPLASTDGNERGYENKKFLGNVFIEISFLDDFTFKSNLGIEQSSGEYVEFIDPFRTSFGRAINGRGVSNIDKYNYRIFDNILTYSRKVDKHDINFMLGYISQYFLWEDQWLTTTSFPGDQITTAGAGSIVDNYGVSKAERKNISYISRINYSFKDRYLLTFNIRRDGSSIFGPDNRFGYFPSLSLGWRIHDEKFLASANWISDFRLRSGWGINGNDPISPYAYLGITSTGANYTIGSTITPGIYPSTIENRGLKWEETQQLNIGIDLSIFNGRFSTTIDVYNKQTDDVLFDNIPIPQSTGFSSARGNAIGIRNKGIEFMLNSINTNKKVKWSTNLNFSINKNEVISLRTNEIPGGWIVNRGASTISRLNQPLSLFYGFEYAGVDPDNGRAQYVTANGELSYTPDEADRKIIGNPHPDFVYGLTNNFAYKNFGLTIFIQGTQGNDMINATRFDIEAMNNPSNQSAEVLKRWSMPGDITNVPGVSQIGNVENSILSTRFVEDASYVRLKTLTLSYNIPDPILSKFKAKALTFYATGENLFTLTDYSGFDPEVNAFGGNGLSMGIDYGTYPQTRKIIFGLNLTL